MILRDTIDCFEIRDVAPARSRRTPLEHLAHPPLFARPRQEYPRGDRPFVSAVMRQMPDPIDPENLPVRRPLWRRALMLVAQVLVGLGLGAVITEAVFSRRDGGAFPHVNFYVPDPELGVRLEPGASMRFQLRENPRTTIHVNSHGYRGDEWPVSGDEILVVGDSQVFGLGVGDDATFSARLARHTGRTVINGGVPTYGPAEYLAVARELLIERKPRVVVVTLNFVNDPFELGRPNRERHAVWDGWAVRSETAPAELFEFPGRRWLFSRSHAVYALRRWLHEGEQPGGAELDDPVDLGTPSEGGLHDLVLASQSARAQTLDVTKAARADIDRSQERLGKIDGELLERRDKLDRLVTRASEFQFDFFKHQIARGRPGDIVSEGSSEASRSVQITAAMIRQAAREREALLTTLLAKEAKKAMDGQQGKREAHDLVAAEAALLAERVALREKIANNIPPIPPLASIFRAYLEEFKLLCSEHGAELVVVALPIDVQVDAGEWAKYGVRDGPDMTGSLLLLDDLVTDARALGVRALDATAALRDAQPGAFLDHDIHMTARGHAALAEALAQTLATPAVPRLQDPAPGLPEGRSFAPSADEWTLDDEVAVKGSTAAGCTTQIRREWLRIQCRRQKPRDGFVAVELRQGGTPASMVMRTPDALSLVTPMTIGEPITARFVWKSATRDLEIRWPTGADGKPRFTGAFVDAPAEQRTPTPHTAVEALCACHEALTHERLCAKTNDENKWYQYPEMCTPVCGNLWGDPDLDTACLAAHGDKCEDRIACAQNDPLAAPTCPEGQTHAFASNACFAVCDPARPCTTGTCTPWQGGGVCV